MPRFVGVAVGISLLLILATLGIWLSQKSGRFAQAMGCRDQVSQRIDSPDGELSVFNYVRKCGATAPDSLQWNVQPSGSNLDSEKYPAFLVLDSKAKATLEWRNKRGITVRLMEVTNTYRNESESAGVGIVYKKDKKIKMEK